MKNLIKSALPFCLLLFLLSSTKAQNNQATIFELDQHNINTVVTDVINLISSHPHPIVIPPANDLLQFFSTPFANSFYPFGGGDCDTPGIRVFEQGGNLSFRFDNMSPGNNQLLFVGSMDYLTGPSSNNFAVYGSEVHSGIDYSAGSMQYHIFMVAKYCPANAATPFSQATSKVEIVIVDKNIL